MITLPKLFDSSVVKGTTSSISLRLPANVDSMLRQVAEERGDKISDVIRSSICNSLFTDFLKLWFFKYVNFAGLIAHNEDIDFHQFQEETNASKHEIKERIEVMQNELTVLQKYLEEIERLDSSFKSKLKETIGELHDRSKAGSSHEK